jgi:2'-5' RNA ligase
VPRFSPPDQADYKSNRIRAFVAVDLPDPLRVRLGKEIDRLARVVGRDVVRWVNPRGIHLTLKFLGDVDPSQIGEIMTTIRSAAAERAVFRVGVGGVGCFPGPRRPRVVWVGVEEASGTLARLQSDLEAGLGALGFAREDREFNPHLTLGRVRREARPVEAAKLGAVLAGWPKEPLGEIEVREVTLFRSELKPSGAVYTQLGIVGLEGTA